MKKTLLLASGILLSSSLAMACLGGGSLQVLDSATQSAVATYDIRTGDMVARSRSFEVIKVQIADQKKSNLCVDSQCEELKDLKVAKDIIVTYRQQMSGDRKTVTIKNVMIGSKAPVTRGMIPKDLAPAEIKMDDHIIGGCAKSN